jgi:pimeloyl-ACP methyl ester carboxylesterase
MMITREPSVFIHGLESSSRGTKGVFFRERYPGMIVEDFWGSFKERMEKLESLLESKTNLTLVGSSYGGLMAAVFARLHPERVIRLILLAPALHLEPFASASDTKMSTPVTIVHGLQDDVVPLDAVREIARRAFVELDFMEVDDDHSLHATFPILDWDTLLVNR